MEPGAYKRGSAGAEAMSHCTSCGKPLTPGVAFCTACGATIGAAPSAPGMPPVAIAPAARRVDASSVIGESFRMTFRHFGAFLGTQGVILVLGSLVGLAILVLYIRPATATMVGAMAAFEADPAGFDPFEFLASMLPLLGGAAASGLVTVLFSLLAGGFGLVTADMLRAGETVSMGAVWAKLGPRFGNYLATGLLVRVAILGVLVGSFALFFLIVPIFAGIVITIYLYLRWAMAGPASIFESLRPAENMKRSSELTKGVRGDLFVVGLVAIALSVIPAIVFGSILGLAAPMVDPFAPPPLWVDISRWAFGAVAQLVTAFFLSAAFMGFYRRLTG